MNHPASRTAEIRKVAQAADGRAEKLLADLLRDLFRIEARNVAINQDQYSLNSLNSFSSRRQVIASATTTSA